MMFMHVQDRWAARAQQLSLRHWGVAQATDFTCDSSFKWNKVKKYDQYWKSQQVNAVKAS